MDRLKKQETVAQLKDIISSSTILLVAKNKGITAAQSKALRRTFNENGGGIMVTKNNLVKIAAQGSEYTNILDLFKGPTIIFYSDSDPVSVAKTSVEFTKANETLEILGGAMDGKKLTQNNIQELATMPSLDELRSKIVGLINAPGQQLLRMIQTPGQQIAGAIQAIAKQK